MKFVFSRRLAKIGVLNTRNEKHGKEKKVPAGDITIRFPLKIEELDTVVITNPDMPKFSEVMFDEKGNLLTNMISPLKINRKPENLYVVIFDKELPGGASRAAKKGRKSQKSNGIDPARALEFEPVKGTNVTLELGSGPNIVLSFTIQLHPSDSDWARLVKIMEQDREVLIDQKQEEMFGEQGGKNPDADDDEDDEDDGE